MRITEITLTPVRYPAPHRLRWGWGETDSMGSTIVQVVTDEGLTGIGDASAGFFRGSASIELQRAFLKDQLLPLLVGQDPLDVGRLWQALAPRSTGPWS